MNFFASSSFGPQATPTAIKNLIIASCIIAMLSMGVQELCDKFGIFPGPQNILALSWWGIHHFFVWQPLTFLFVYHGTGEGLSFSFIVTLLINMYLFWVLGTSLFELIGRKAFLLLYTCGTIGAGCFALLLMLLTGQYEMVSGIAPAVMLIATVWAMAFPETEIYLFFLIPMKAKAIVGSIIAALLILALINWNLSLFFLYVGAVLIGYGCSSYFWGWKAPYTCMAPFDAWLEKIGFAGRRRRNVVLSEKIVDISSGQSTQDDDAFVDAMLTKISRYGEEALSWGERRRLQKISDKKMRR